MSRWFRFHADAMRNPKVARLSDAQFRLWVELMAVAADNDGHIPPLDDLKHILKRRLDHLSRGLDDLLRAGLMDPLEDGFEPHNWSKHQYKSDVSTARVHKHRSKRNVSETPPETEADTETEKVEPSGSSARADKFPCPASVDALDWQALKANRRAKRAALSEGAHRQIVRKLDAWAGEGWPPGPIVAFAAERGWTTVFETDEMKAPRNDRSQNPRSNYSGSAKPRNGIDAALDRRLGLDDSPGPLGRRDARAGAGHSGGTPALPGPSGRPQF